MQATSHELTEFPSTEASPAPPLRLLGVEPLRALLEFAGMCLMDKQPLPRGNGEPVVLFPGLASDRHSTAPLKSFCESLGYTAYDWGRGFNTGPQGDVGAWLSALADDVRQQTAHHRHRVNLIGWSLGGIYAREVAKLMPSRTRQVITIGTPFADMERNHVGWLYRLLNRTPAALDDALRTRLQKAPPAPTTSIYSRSDGIVAWQACIQDSRAPHVHHVEVDGGHVGMGWNPAVLEIVAHKLKRPGRLPRI